MGRVIVRDMDRRSLFEWLNAGFYDEKTDNITILKNHPQFKYGLFTVRGVFHHEIHHRRLNRNPLVRIINTIPILNVLFTYVIEEPYVVLATAFCRDTWHK